MGPVDPKFKKKKLDFDMTDFNKKKVTKPKP